RERTPHENPSSHIAPPEKNHERAENITGTRLLRRNTRLQLLEPVQDDVNLRLSARSGGGLAFHARADDAAVGHQIVGSWARRLGNPESTRHKDWIAERHTWTRSHRDRCELARRRY